MRNAWSLDPAISFLNHGSFGACPTEVLEQQRRLQDRLEADPVRFFATDLEGLLDEARLAAAAFIGAPADGFGFVTNATAGVNTALRSAPLGVGDEILVTDHGYGACLNAAEAIAERRGAAVRVAQIPVPVSGPDAVLEAVLSAATSATRLAVIDHVTSPTAVVFPIAEIVAALAERGVETIVDGAHAPGMVDLDVGALGAAAYAGNWHKWVCAPKGAGFLWVSKRWRDRVEPLVVSHGATAAEADRFRATFDWVGTIDPTPYLTVPTAIAVVGGMMSGGWPAVRQRNREMALGFRSRFHDAGLASTASEEMAGAMAAVVLPDRLRPGGEPREAARALIRHLSDRGVAVAVSARHGTDDLTLRVSAHLHTANDDLDPLLLALAG